MVKKGAGKPGGNLPPKKTISKRHTSAFKSTRSTKTNKGPTPDEILEALAKKGIITKDEKKKAISNARRQGSKPKMLDLGSSPSHIAAGPAFTPIDAQRLPGSISDLPGRRSDFSFPTVEEPLPPSPQSQTSEEELAQELNAMELRGGRRRKKRTTRRHKKKTTTRRRKKRRTSKKHH